MVIQIDETKNLNAVISQDISQDREINEETINKTVIGATRIENDQTQKSSMKTIHVKLVREKGEQRHVNKFKVNEKPVSFHGLNPKKKNGRNKMVFAQGLTHKNLT